MRMQLISSWKMPKKCVNVSFGNSSLKEASKAHHKLSTLSEVTHEVEVRRIAVEASPGKKLARLSQQISRAWWYTQVIPATWEAQGLRSKAGPRQKDMTLLKK
jgi:hypothetical protein